MIRGFLRGALDQAGWPVAWQDEILISLAAAGVGGGGESGQLGDGRPAHPRAAGVRPRAISGRWNQASPGATDARPSSRPSMALGSEISSRDGCLPVDLVGGRLAGGRLQLRPEVSSQFVSSLLLAGPLMTNGLDLEVVGPGAVAALSRSHP